MPDDAPQRPRARLGIIEEHVSPTERSERSVERVLALPLRDMQLEPRAQAAQHLLGARRSAARDDDPAPGAHDHASQRALAHAGGARHHHGTAALEDRVELADRLTAPNQSVLPLHDRLARGPDHASSRCKIVAVRIRTLDSESL